MMEFINSCKQWFIENEVAMSSILTPATFVSVIVSIGTIIKLIFSNKKNLLASGELKESLLSNKALSDGVTSLKDTLNEYKSELDKVHNENSKLKEQIDVMKNETLDMCNVIDTKLRAMLDVQSIVYSTIKDDNIRNTVSGLLVNARYAESISRAKLKREAEELKSKVADKMTEIQDLVDKNADVVEGIVNSDESVSDNSGIMRY